MSRCSLFALFVVLLASEPASASSTFRCNSRLVSLEASTAQVRERCGEPSSKAMVGYKEVVDEYGYLQEVVVEEWVYGPSHGMYHYLRFEGNRLRSIDSQRGT